MTHRQQRYRTSRLATAAALLVSTVVVGAVAAQPMAATADETAPSGTGTSDTSGSSGTPLPIDGYDLRTTGVPRVEDYDCNWGDRVRCLWLVVPETRDGGAADPERLVRLPVFIISALVPSNRRPDPVLWVDYSAGDGFINGHTRFGRDRRRLVTLRLRGQRVWSPAPSGDRALPRIGAVAARSTGVTRHRVRHAEQVGWLSKHERAGRTPGPATRPPRSSRPDLVTLLLIFESTESDQTAVRDASALIATAPATPSATSIASTFRACDGDVGEPLFGHAVASYWVAFSPDGSRLASSGGDRTVRFWDPATGDQLGEPIRGHSTPDIFGMSFDRDWTLLATSGGDETVRLWDPATHQPIGEPLVGDVGHVWTVATSPDGTVVAFAGDDTTVRLWRPDVDGPGT